MPRIEAVADHHYGIRRGASGTAAHVEPPRWTLQAALAHFKRAARTSQHEALHQEHLTVPSGRRRGPQANSNVVPAGGHWKTRARETDLQRPAFL